MKQTTRLMLFATAVTVLATMPVHADDAEFVSLANDYIAELFRMEPEWATLVGEHAHDTRLTDRSAAGIAARTAVNRDYLGRLAKIDRSRLSKVNAIDHEILVQNLERMIFENEELREWEWNPLYYNFGGAIYALLARDFAPLESRLRDARDRMLTIPDVIAAAQANLKNPPRVHTETAILQNKGNISLIRDTYNAFLPDDNFREEVREVQFGAIERLEAYGKWLEEDLLPRSTGEFRLGDAMWRRKLRFTLDSDLSKEAILDRAMSDLRDTQATMYATAKPLYLNYFPNDEDAARINDAKHVCKAVLDRLAETRPNNETIVPLAEKTLAEATAFAREKKLVTVPDEPVKLIVMPEFQRGVAVAYCDPPGAMEKELDTFYAIAPTPEDWTPERVTSFFREYNNYMLYDLTVHEAVPGHYLQLAHANHFEAPTLIRSIFYSGLFAEGWAVYAEKIMAEAGFGGAEVRMQQLKMRLRVIINAVIDQKIHTEGMTEEEALALMMNEGYQEDGEAAGKWRRACLSSTQLSTYFVGSAEVEDLGRAYRKANPKSSPLEMHDALISRGSPAPKYVRRSLGL